VGAGLRVSAGGGLTCRQNQLGTPVWVELANKHWMDAGGNRLGPVLVVCLQVSSWNDHDLMSNLSVI